MGMNPEIKEKWLKALRSGEYKQGSHYLRRVDDTYCCLGVLCDIYIKEGNAVWDKRGSDVWYIGHSSAYLPGDVKEWAELDVPAGWANYKDPDYSLTHMNDQGESFERIAQKIEEVL